MHGVVTLVFNAPFLKHVGYFDIILGEIFCSLTHQDYGVKKGGKKTPLSLCAL